MLHGSGIHGFSFIAVGQADTILIQHTGDPDFRLGNAVVDGISHKIIKDTLQFIEVSADFHMIRQMQLQPDSLFLHKRIKACQLLLQHGIQINSGDLQL